MLKKMKIAYKVLVVFILSLTACGHEKSQTETSGSTSILVDESFEPIVEDQWFVFESLYPRAKIKLIAQPEVNLVNTLLADSVSRVAIMSRELRKDEAAVFERKEIKVRTTRFAVDGVALLTNVASPDSTITVQEIIDIIKGANGKHNLVFDNANSSTVRYLKELAAVKELPAKGVYALKSNPEVIKYLHNNSGAIGVIGINWFKQPSPELEPLIKTLRVMGVKNLPGKEGSDKYYKPSQDNLAMELYPLRRSLYIINCQGGNGLGWGFSAFIAGETGQRIVLKSGLLPDSIPPRDILIKK